MKLIFVIPTTATLADGVINIMYYVYNNRARELAVHKRYDIHVIQTMDEAKALQITEGENIELFLYTGRKSVITTELFTVLNVIVAKTTEAKIEKADITILAG